jgi:ribosome-associated protein
MKHNLPIKQGIIIPESELEITTSRSGGAGGQHVNKTNSRVTIRWNVGSTTALTDEQKQRVLQKLHNSLTTDGDLIIHHSSSRSQQQNKQLALEQLMRTVEYALHIPKKRTATHISKATKQARLATKAKRGELKKLRGKKYQGDE